MTSTSSAGSAGPGGDSASTAGEGRDVQRKRNLRELQAVPGVGPAIAADLLAIGVRGLADLRDRDPESLYLALCDRAGGPVDRCVLYAMRCAVYFASHTARDPALLKWWNWKDRT